MDGIREQRAYWSRVAGAKDFRHPFRGGVFEPHVRKDARVLDLGCGTGRLTAELRERGWSRVVGADTAEGMVSVGRRARPELDLLTVEPGTLPFDDRSFEAVLLFSVLTCIPVSDEEDALMDEVYRVLAPGGVLYVSDLLLQKDERNAVRYDEGEGRFGIRGVFELPEGVVLRHFTLGRLEELTEGFDRFAYDELELLTMNGNPARAFQILARRP